MGLGAAVVRSLREGALWVFGALALIVLAALVTYDRHDPSFATTGEPGPISNVIGPFGAHLAGLLVLLFGVAAFLFPLMIASTGWLLYQERDSTGPAPSRATLVFRGVGFLLTLVTTCGLASLHFMISSYPDSAGGVLGSLVGNGLAAGLSFLGATLLLLALWLAGVSLFAGLSWIEVMDRTGRAVLSSLERLSRWIMNAREIRAGREVKEARAEAVREERKRVENRPPPKIETVVRKVEKSERVEKERQVAMFEPSASKELPPLSLLDDPPVRAEGYSAEALEAMSRLVELKLRDFGVEAEVVAVHPGPVITRFELNPAPGIKVSQISNLAKDLARALSAISVRIVEVIPGKSTVGLEIPNEKREIVTLGEIVKSKAYDDMNSSLALVLGKDISGAPVVADLARMPHLLVGGTTGSGKSTAVNAMILSLLYKSSADHVRMIMIDPKMLELSVYEGIPHLLAPVVTDMKEAANALRWCVAEMERRYQLMAALGVRNLAGFNRKIREAREGGQPIRDPLLMKMLGPDADAQDAPFLEPLPFIVVIVDELADMMMIVGKKVEELIARLAQKARASGIHLILATQRPSVDVITGLIKANIPTRIAFQVSAKVDSRTILDQMGAEQLLGHGDMLFLQPGTSVPVRVHGAFVSDQEVHRVVGSLKGAEPNYVSEILEGPSGPIPGLPGEGGEGTEDGQDGEQDPLYDQAVRIVIESRRASISGVQRRLKIGYNRAARMIETMEAAGLVGPLQSNGSREVLAPPPAGD
ncbi:cell division protein FtsK [Steroidobacter denitrificans]|uniref:DNA translocase FtsK n=1 Tax=Steroidobacter denitrificans TaxID=465721 RepID=A0A127FC95_STEDE|nr:cell division protein FtsK [Steroidobacter denitrificans]